MNKTICYCLVTLLLLFCGLLRANENTTIAQQFVQRMAPAAQGHVRFELAPQEGVTIAPTAEGKTLIRGKDARHLIVGFGYYARHIADAQWSWNGDTLPATWPAPEEEIELKLPWKRVFAFNYCTLSYSCAFWDWARWEREIDFLAMQGYDHVLVQAGLELVWQKVLQELKYPDEKIEKFIPNPAFAAWWNMGNLQGHGGPMSVRLVEQEGELGRRIATRLRQFNMTPVLQGFVGLVPHDIAPQLPQGARLMQQGQWCGFQRPAVLDPTDAAFAPLAKLWYAKLHEVYGGPTAAYGGDLFHEGGNAQGIDITAAARAVEQGMQAASPNACWVLQAWGGNPKPALLRGLSKDKCFVLLLDKGLHAPGAATQNLEGIPWLWTELANFGGNNSGLFGGLVGLSKLPSHLAAAQEKMPHLQGMGMLSEGIEQNPIHYELFHHMFTRFNDVDLDKWIEQYVAHRYGQPSPTATKAWQLLAQDSYKPKHSQEGCYEGILCARPSWGVTRASSWSPTARHDSPATIAQAAQLLSSAALEGEAYTYDVVDLTRQVLSDYCWQLLPRIKAAHEAKDKELYAQLTAEFLQCMVDLDRLLASCPHTLLGKWCQRALNKGGTEEEKRLMLRAAKMLVTTWSEGISGLNDYSNRHWAGLMGDYYLPRWRLFFESQARLMADDAPRAEEVQQQFITALNAHDTGFHSSPTTYSTTPTGQGAAIARELLQQYAPKITKLAAPAK